MASRSRPLGSISSCVSITFLLVFGFLAYRPTRLVHAFTHREDDDPSRPRHLHANDRAYFHHCQTGEEAVQLVQKEKLLEEREIPDPELYYEQTEEESEENRADSTLLIWPPDETLPRDVMAGKPQVWVFCSLTAQRATLEFLPLFLNHYVDLGVGIDHMVFVIQLVVHEKCERGKEDGLPVVEDIIAVLSSVGADYRVVNVWTPECPSSEYLTRPWSSEMFQFDLVSYEAMLLALHRVPIKDWIITVRVHELLSFKGLDAFRYFRDCESQVSFVPVLNSHCSLKPGSLHLLFYGRIRRNNHVHEVHQCRQETGMTTFFTLSIQFSS